MPGSAGQTGTGGRFFIKVVIKIDKDSVAIITGANSGIGKAISLELAKLGAVVVMLCRNKTRGAEALKEVRSISGNTTVDLMLCDLGSLQSIEGFCLEFNKSINDLTC